MSGREEKCWKYGERTEYCNCEYCSHVDECVMADHGTMSEIMIDE